MFEDIYTTIDDPSKLVQSTAEESFQLKSQYPKLSMDYFSFLKEVGSGNLGNLVIYPAPLLPVEVYTSARLDALAGIVLFGDDMQGFCYGFDLNDGGRVVEVDPRGNLNRTIERDFLDFLRCFLK